MDRDIKDAVSRPGVPWIIHAEGARDRAPRRAEIKLGLSLLPAFLALLPRLRIVVTAGRMAGLATPMLRETRPDSALFAMPPSEPGIREHLTGGPGADHGRPRWGQRFAFA